MRRNRRIEELQDYSSLNDDLHLEDRNHHDACALICAVRKGGQPTHGNIKRTIEALARMGHRTGYINGEGDGVGILTDIPRQLWSKWLAEDGLIPTFAAERTFWVAHLFIPAFEKAHAADLVDRVCQAVSEAGLHLLTKRHARVNSLVLGPNAALNEPDFYQIAGVAGHVTDAELDAVLFELQIQLEDELGVHFPSFSRYSVVYKVQGTIEILRRYYPELRDPDYASTVTLGHARYSTNTNPIFERAQPFSVIGHNGEFNTISRFRMEAHMLGIPLPVNGSDSQDVDRMIHTLTARFGLDLIEVMEHIFPPYPHDLMQDRDDIAEVYQHIRQAWGHFAQGPAAVAARLGNQLVFSVDALGLRPLWFGETEKEYFASSERGVYHLDSMSVEPQPMAPGEKIALQLTPGNGVEVLRYPDIQMHVLRRYARKHLDTQEMMALQLGPAAEPNTYPNNNEQSHANGHAYSYEQRKDNGHAAAPTVSTSVMSARLLDQQMAAAQALLPAAQAVAVADALLLPQTAVLPQPPMPWQHADLSVDTALLSGMGWERYHVSWVETLAQSGKEQIGSLGWDGALAALSQKRTNLADFFKETVAVVTNPAIDREREQSQFSTRMFIGARPHIEQPGSGHPLQLDTPLILGGLGALGDLDLQRGVAQAHGTVVLQDLLAVFAGRAAVLAMDADLDEPIAEAVARLQAEAVEAVRAGAECLLLDDTESAQGHRLWLDPLLVTAAVDQALRTAPDAPNLRRRLGIVVRSGALRDLHDVALCVSLGANAVLPYALYAVAVGIAPKRARTAPDRSQLSTGLDRAVNVLTKGLQKVTSTIGCHELRGYGHSFSAIGLSTSIAQVFGTPNYFGSEARGLTWEALHDDAQLRRAEIRGEARARLDNPDRFFPKMWKKVEAVAQGEKTWDAYTEEVRELEQRLPVSLRHLIGLRQAPPEQRVPAGAVRIGVGSHDLPLIISAMSFGSQGELAYRTYAEAAKLLNIICMNGEGGELPDMMDQYKPWRGQQIASARFGVNIAFLNSADYLEIKIGQGAKPGEGGHLPGHKVTAQVAQSRHTMPGVDLISPSNNHDLYSIEDLAQLIDELKTANPHARISVKIPVVQGVGVIAMGVAKAGADIITITGYTGGTGAARAHALRHVGLPAEIGVWLAHHALLSSGLRKNVELWVDGGMKSGRDVVKMMCLGANRVGFGTLAMVSVGCTICRGCQDGTCHVGITTHVQTPAEAQERGFKAFRPFEEKGSPEGIYRVFSAIAEEVRTIVGQLGFSDAQAIVGRADLLEQQALHDRIDLTPLLKRAPETPAASRPGGLRISRPRNIISRHMTEVIASYVRNGELELTYDDEQVMAMDRALGTHLSGAIKRGDVPHAQHIQGVHLSFSNSAVPGNGLGAFLDEPVTILVEGGAQDGVAKCALGGTVHVLKGLNHNGVRLDGSVGKSFAYGAQGGTFIVQGNADTRACIRLSGADVIFGGEVDRRQPLRDELGGIGARANLKGYAFEYMTSGRALVLGDPGPWICAGMTGGVVYQRIQPEVNLTVEAIQRRIAPGASVEIQPLDAQGAADVQALLGVYIQTLEQNNQPEAVQHLLPLHRSPASYFVKIAPRML